MRRNKNPSYSQKIDNLYGPLSFAWMIKALRENAKLTKEQMSEKLGVSVRALNELESGAHIPSPQLVLHIGQKLEPLGIPTVGLVQLAVRDARFQKNGVLRPI
jgi:transcriptional regulator with XRE-family HTH domain